MKIGPLLLISKYLSPGGASKRYAPLGGYLGFLVEAARVPGPGRSNNFFQGPAYPLTA
jgi:hypothetical protein